MTRIVITEKRYDHVEMLVAGELMSKYELLGVTVVGTLFAGSLTMEFETYIPQKALEGRSVEEVILEELAKH